MLRLRSTTRHKLEALYHSEERHNLDWLKRHLARPLGDWQCTPNPYARARGTAKLTAELLPVPTVPIPIYEQETDRIPLEL